MGFGFNSLGSSRRLAIKVALVIWGLAFSSSSQANYLVDTGDMIQEGYGGANIFAGINVPPNITPLQSIAGRFYIDKPQRVTFVEGWLAAEKDGNISVAIYSDQNNRPGIEVGVTSLQVSRLSWDFGVAAGWFGAKTDNWLIQPGTYWLSFEVRPSDSLYGIYPGVFGMVTMMGTAPQPLNAYAINGGFGWYLNADPYEFANNGFGMRITADTAPIPEPSTYALMALGLGAVAYTSRRRRKADASVRID